MPRTECGDTVVLTMKRRRGKKGQALIEYGFLMVLLATIGFAVVALAGNQIMGLYDEVSYELTHITSQTTLAPYGPTTLAPCATPSAGSSPPVSYLEQRGT